VLQLLNQTPFVAKIIPIPDEHGVETLYIIIKALFQIAGNCVTEAPEQATIELADTYTSSSTDSSLWQASEIHLTKPGTDVVVRGDAFSPHGRPVSQLDVSVAVGNLQKTVRVFGARRWQGTQVGRPEPFSRLPLLYEHSSGGVLGTDAHGVPRRDPRNPVGVGKSSELPRIEDPANLISSPKAQPQPAGFGFIAPHWEPRRSRVGTYNEHWKTSRAPYLPEDFQMAHFHSAHPDLVAPTYLEGGEPVELINFFPRPTLKFSLPKCSWKIEIHVGQEVKSTAMNLESVVLDPSTANLAMLWRGSYPCDKRLLSIEKIALQLQQLEGVS